MGNDSIFNIGLGGRTGSYLFGSSEDFRKYRKFNNISSKPGTSISKRPNDIRYRDFMSKRYNPRTGPVTGGPSKPRNMFPSAGDFRRRPGKSILRSIPSGLGAAKRTMGNKAFYGMGSMMIGASVIKAGANFINNLGSPTPVATGRGQFGLDVNPSQVGLGGLKFKRPKRRYV